MHPYTILPNSEIKSGNIISDTFLSLGIRSFLEACRYVHQLPYGYNSDRDDLMILFKEKMGTCSTKHAVIGSLAAELGLRGADSVYVAVASRLDLPLVTFDIDQRERARAKVIIQAIE